MRVKYARKALAMGAYIDLRDWDQLSTNGAHDNLSIFNEAVQQGGEGSLISFPRGDMSCTGEIVCNKANMRFIGVQRRGSRINFVPSQAGTLFNVSAPNPATTQINRVQIENLMLYSTDTEYSKTMIKGSNTGRMKVSKVVIVGPTLDGSVLRGDSGGDGGSVGIHALGREQAILEDLSVYAQVPLRFSRNPSEVGGQYSMDHVSVRDVVLAPLGASYEPSGLPHACVLIDGNTRVSLAEFCGHQAWVGGKYGLYWVAATMAEASGRLRLHGVLTEQLHDDDSWSIYIDIADGQQKLNALEVSHCSMQPNRRGIHTKNVAVVDLDNLTATQTTGVTLLDAEGADRVAWRNLISNAAAPASLINLPSDMTLSSSTHTAYGSGKAIPTDAVYVRNNAVATQRPLAQTGPVARWTWRGEIENGSSQQIPVDGNVIGTEFGRVTVVATSAPDSAGTYMASGSFAIARNASGTNGITKEAGTANMVVGVGDAGEIGLNTATADLGAAVRVWNKSGETVHVMVCADIIRSASA